MDSEINQEQEIEILQELENTSKGDDIYDFIREKVNSFQKERFQGKYGEVLEYLMALPDFIALLVRLARDSRVPATQKLMIGGIILYVVSPIDILPDFIPVLGLVDDLLLVVYGLNSILNEVDPEIVKEHWSGKEDLLELLQKCAGIADKFLSQNVVNRVSKLFKSISGGIKK